MTTRLKAVTVAILGAIVVGLAIGRFDAILLARYQSAEPLWIIVVLMFGAAAAAVPAVGLGKSFPSAAAFALLVLAIELTAAVLSRGCEGGGACAQALVASLTAPLMMLYLVVSLPCSALLWWLRRTQRTS